MLHANKWILSVNMSAQVVNGVRYLVAPSTVARQVVMNGIFTPASQLKKSVKNWEKVPVTLNHPKDNNGDYISANDGGVIVGFTKNAKMDGDKLKMELWLNEEEIKKHPKLAKIIKLSENGNPAEVSTGFYSDSHKNKSNGTYNGRKFGSIHKNIKPDHLAILTNEPGACSNEDGCGINVHNQNHCNCGNDNNCSCQSNQPKEDSMERDEIIESLIANEYSPFDETDREFLKEASDEKLKAHSEYGRTVKKSTATMGDSRKAVDDEIADDDDSDDDDMSVSKKKKKKKMNRMDRMGSKGGVMDYSGSSNKVKANEFDAAYLEECISSITDHGFQLKVNELIEQDEAEKKALRKSIISNARVMRDELEKAVESLDKKSLIAVNENIKSRKNGDAAYAGRGGSVLSTNESEKVDFKIVESSYLM